MMQICTNCSGQLCLIEWALPKYIVHINTKYIYCIQGCVLSPYLFNLYSEYIMRQANLEELDIGVKMGGTKINSLRYADDTTLLAESKEELLQL